MIFRVFFYFPESGSENRISKQYFLKPNQPHENFNLTTELKNIANSKKADGTILKDEDAIAVIELKGTDTTDLEKIETLAFGYKNQHPKCALCNYIKL